MKRLLVLMILVASAAHAQEAEYRAAIFCEPSMPVVGAATPPDTFESVFSQEDIPSTRLNVDQVCDPATFNSDKFDLLVVPTGASYPAMGKEALIAFLKRGGDLFCTGGYAFDSLFFKRDGQWVPQETLLKEARKQAADPAVSLLPNGGFEKGAEGWVPLTAAECTVAAEPGCTGTACGRAAKANTEGGCAWRTVLPVEPGKTYLVGARLKTGPVQGSGYAYMAVYQYATDNKILHFVDFIQKGAASDWQRYETMVDVVPGAARVEFSAGFYRASGTAWFDDVTCAPMPHEVRINAHYGKPEDGLIVEPDQLMMFSPDQKFRIGSSSWMDEDKQSDARAGEGGVDGLLSGYEATAQLNAYSLWEPVLKESGDAVVEPQTAGAFVWHYSGPFKQSVWVLFGVDNKNIFSEGKGTNILGAAVKKLKLGLSIRSLKTDQACYNPGQTVRINACFVNFSKKLCSADIHIFSDTKSSLGPSQVTIQPRSESQVEATCNADPFYPATLVYASINWESSTKTLFCVRSKGGMISRGSQVHCKENAFEVIPSVGQPGHVCLFGTDTYANMFLSPNYSPFKWQQDIELMRKHGLDLFENLQFTPSNYVYSETQWQQLDSIIQLSQYQGLIYMAGLLIGHDVAVSEEELEKQAQMCMAFAKRYKEVPGLIYYLNGDYQLKLKDLPDLRREWNATLRERYGSDTAAREVWKEIVPADGGELPVTDRAAQSWYDPKARDVMEFKARLIRRWNERLSQTIRVEDKEHPITGEYYQRTYNGIDLRLTMESMDASNFGYFDLPKRDLAKLMATIKWNDMRLVDKMVNIGEFGVKTHDAWSLERGGAGYHIQRTPEEYEQLVWWVVHAALAMGVSKIQNWCWADDPDRIFPWGLCYNNPLRPKPVLELYGNLRVAAGLVPIEYTAAETVFVMPDSWRTGAPEDFAHSTLINAHECLLAANIPYDTANETHLDRLLQKSPKFVIMPMAYALSDATLEKLHALAEEGACVYLSGDPSIGPDGVRRPERLETFLGVKYESETIHPAGPPVPTVAESDAIPVTNPCGIKLYWRKVGRGYFLWTPEPWETFKGKDIFVDDPCITADPAQNLYLSLARTAGIVPAAQVTADNGVWRVMVTPTNKKQIVTVFPRSEVTTPTKVNVKGEEFDLTFEFRKTWPAMVLLDEKNDPQMATGTGPVAFNGQPLANGPGAWIVSYSTASATSTGTVTWRDKSVEITRPHQHKEFKR